MTRPEIDTRRSGGTEVLYDQPYEDNKRIRVAGPFTVESLSPHRVLFRGRGTAGMTFTARVLSPGDMSN